MIRDHGLDLGQTSGPASEDHAMDTVLVDFGILEELLEMVVNLNYKVPSELVKQSRGDSGMEINADP